MEDEFALGRNFNGHIRPGNEQPRFAGQRIHRMPLGTAILMMDAITLIVAPKKTRADKFGDRSTQIAFAGGTDAVADFLANGPIPRSFALWQ